MKHQNILTLLLAACLCMEFTACGDEEITAPAMAAPVATGQWVDERDGEIYNWVQSGNLQWMTDNFRYDIGSYTDCRNYIEPEDWVQYAQEQLATRNWPKYGMYYSIPGALQACPDGWRLPTDDEWQQLEQALGMTADESARYDWRGNIAANLVETKDHNTYARFLLGGYITFYTTNSYLTNGSRFKGAWGYYWTSTQDERSDGTLYIYRKFAYNRAEICRQSMQPQNQLLNVRYVRDAGKN